MECSTPSVVDQFDVKLQKSQRNFFTLAELLAG